MPSLIDKESFEANDYIIWSFSPISGSSSPSAYTRFAKCTYIPKRTEKWFGLLEFEHPAYFDCSWDGGNEPLSAIEAIAEKAFRFQGADLFFNFELRNGGFNFNSWWFIPNDVKKNYYKLSGCYRATFYRGEHPMMMDPFFMRFCWGKIYDMMIKDDSEKSNDENESGSFFIELPFE